MQDSSSSHIWLVRILVLISLLGILLAGLGIAVTALSGQTGPDFRQEGNVSCISECRDIYNHCKTQCLNIVLTCADACSAGYVLCDSTCQIGT